MCNAAAIGKSWFYVQLLDNYLIKKPADEVKQLALQVNPTMVGINLWLSNLPALH
jgi:hypothetical protein